DRISTVGIVTSLQDDQSTLRSLRWDIGAGIAAGVVISLLAGLFLAGRAWVPIRKAWEKQQRFVADASHELRTPTSVIRAQTELLLRRPERTIEQESPNIALMLQESRRMSALLEDLLTLARSDSNQLELQSEILEADRLIMEMIEPFKLLAETKEIELVAKLEQPLVLRGDADRIRQLLVILLDNALKFTPSSGRIEVSGSIRSNHVALSVSDTGSGIADEDLPHVFERFYRGDKVRSRSEGGTGLGLSIAKWIVEAHKGSIRIESKPGMGTKVEALFPRHH
ncbi:MAG: sensor histidine kinase, partial [Cohnella sp.]|nr:sensor histidine kinase [Cohnella sp.]